VDVDDADEWEDNGRTSRGIRKVPLSLDLKVIKLARCALRTGSIEHQFGKVCFIAFEKLAH